MEQYRVAILRKEFPFIDCLFVDAEGKTEVRPEEVNDVKIKRGDRTLLGKKGSEDRYDWSGGGHYDYTKYFAVWSDKDGEHVVVLKGTGCSGNGSGERHEWDEDTIGEQLFVGGIVPDYIVECVKNDHDDNGNGEVTRYWTIYKMRGFDLVAHHQERIDRAAAALKAEIALACA